MSLYDLVVADGRQQERGALLLAALGNPIVTRYRDSWVENGDDGPVIAVYTRQGGGNRECYCDSGGSDPRHAPESCYAACNEELQEHPLYLRDADDDFDRTYATFYFRAPDEHREALEGFAGDPVDMSARWQDAIDRIGSGDLRPAETAAMDQIGAALSDPDGPAVIQI